MPKEKTSQYCSGNGLHQSKYSQIWSEHVPASGMCILVAAEQLRCASKLYHDYFNNGWCNWDTYEYERAMIRQTIQNIPSLPKIDWSDESYDENDFYHGSISDETELNLELIMDAIFLQSWNAIYN